MCFSGCRSWEVVELAVVGAARAGVARDGAVGIWCVVIVTSPAPDSGAAAIIELWQREVTRHITVGWCERDCSAGAPELEVIEHPAVVVSQFGYFVGLGGAAARVGKTADSAWIRASVDR